MNHGISKHDLLVIRTILISTCSNIDKVCLFGSRATGKFGSTSDIDLVLYGDISERESSRLNTHFQESSIAHKVYIVVYQAISYPPLKKHIDVAAMLLFTRKDLYGEQDLATSLAPKVAAK